MPCKGSKYCGVCIRLKVAVGLCRVDSDFRKFKIPMVGKPCLGKDLYATKKKLMAKLEEETLQNFLKVTLFCCLLQNIAGRFYFQKTLIYISLCKSLRVYTHFS